MRKILFIIVLFTMLACTVSAEWRRLPNGEWGYYTRGNRLTWYWSNNGSFTFDRQEITDIETGSTADDNKKLITLSYFNDNGGAGGITDIDVSATGNAFNQTATDLVFSSSFDGNSIDAVTVGIDLADSIITEARLAMNDSPADGEVIAYNSSGYMEWVTQSGTGWADKIEENDCSVEVVGASTNTITFTADGNIVGVWGDNDLTVHKQILSHDSTQDIGSSGTPFNDVFFTTLDVSTTSQFDGNATFGGDILASAGTEDIGSSGTPFDSLFVNYITALKIDTGNGFNELYAMNQDVETTDDVTFNDITVSTPSNIYLLSHDSFADYVGNEHIDWTNSTDELTTTDVGNFSEVNTGNGDYELYAMNQDVESTDNVTFADVTATGSVKTDKIEDATLGYIEFEDDAAIDYGKYLYFPNSGWAGSLETDDTWRVENSSGTLQFSRYNWTGSWLNELILSGTTLMPATSSGLSLGNSSVKYNQIHGLYAYFSDGDFSDDVVIDDDLDVDGTTDTDGLVVDGLESVQIYHEAVDADGEWTGDVYPYTAGETVAFGDAVYLHTDGKVYLADCTTTAKANVKGVVIVGGDEDDTVQVMNDGRYCDSSLTLDTGVDIYLSATGTTTNTIDDAKPTTDNYWIAKLGWHISSDVVQISLAYPRWQVKNE